MTVDPNKQYTTTRMLPRSVLKIKKDSKPVSLKVQPQQIIAEPVEDVPKTPSKFSKRFNMLGGGINAQQLERSQTPSTTSSEISSDENQWIRRPPLSHIYDPELASDPQLLHSKLTPKDIGVLQDYVNLWQKNISLLLERLRDTIPGDGMIGEIHYWRDLSRILEAVNTEVKQSYVEITVQVLTSYCEHNKGTEDAV